MKKILLSIATLAFAGAIVAGATGAFFTDTETSTGNTFTAGAIDLKVDSQSHYNGFICVAVPNNDGYEWQAEDGTVETDYSYPRSGDSCNGTWAATDLEDGVQKFFNFTDLKPGDYGEDTISLHVYDNDAWGRLVLTNTVDSDNGCTEPEIADDPDCTVVDPAANGQGELGGALNMEVWLDQGATPGFQNTGKTSSDAGYDSTEGDNKWQSATEPKVTAGGVISTTGGVVYDMWGTFTDAYNADCLSGSFSDDGANGDGECQGLALDGRMVGGTTYYFGVKWDIPADTGNEVQSDELKTDISFEVVQRRNNPSRTF